MKARGSTTMITLFVLLAIGGVRAATAQPSAGVAVHRDTTSTKGSPAPQLRNFVFYLEEDNLQFFSPHTDRNYTLGTGFQWGDERPRLFQDAFLRPLDRWVGRPIGKLFHRGDAPEAGAARLPDYFTRRLEGGAFSPESIGTARIQYGDRPWAMLVGWTVRMDEPTRMPNGSIHMWSSEATLGTIGSPVGEVVQRSIHSIGRTLSGSNTPLDPQGWGNQIMNSRFGVPTGRYKLEYTNVLPPNRWRLKEGPFLDALGQSPARAELLWRLRGEAGYYTDISAGAQLRLGWIRTSSWERNPNLSAPIARVPGAKSTGDVSDLPALQRFFGHLEAYGFAGLDGYLYAYNALMQGYGDFWSKYRMSFDDLEHVTLNGRTGVAIGWLSLDRYDHRHAFQIWFTPEAFRTREFKGGRARAHHWGGFGFVMSENLPR